MNVLVAYATHSGATKTLADTIADALREAGTPAEAVDIENDPDPATARAVVLGSGVRAESLERGFRQWVQRHHEALSARPVAVFSCSGSAADPKKGGKQKAMDSFLASAPFTPVAVQNFPGWVLMDRIPVHERVLLKSMRTPTGDFRDLPAVAAWAREARDQLTPA